MLDRAGPESCLSRPSPVGTYVRQTNEECAHAGYCNELCINNGQTFSKKNKFY